MKRMLYLQYTNAAHYPPLEHSAHILARDGWEVLFVGINIGGAGLEMAPHDRIRHVTVKTRGSAGYPAYAMRALQLARAFRPSWCYVSDHSAAPAALLIERATRCRVLYHEHDAPGAHSSLMRRVSLAARAKLMRAADVVVVPSVGRRELLGPDGRRALVVWNCPSSDEVASNAERDESVVKLVYAGSLSADRLPLTYIEALTKLPDQVRLSIYGYETAGFPGYAAQITDAATRAGVAGRVTFHGAVPRHSALLQQLAHGHVGIATLDTEAGDPNLSTMLGASNKPFDYLAAGLSILVSRQPDWVETYVEPGYGLPCDPRNASSIVTAVTRMLDAQTRTLMGVRGRQRILSDWNYEHQFAPVLERLIA